MNQVTNKEMKFWDALKNLFIGESIEGKSGFVNLMKKKSGYYESVVFPSLRENIGSALKPFPEFREELFDKLYAFFSRYFTKSGSIYFQSTPYHEQVYDQIYTDDSDVMLFWKTHMLYYVKSDRLFANVTVSINGKDFFFDVSGLEHKRANEKRELVYSVARNQKENKITLSVSFSEKGRKTKSRELVRELKTKGIKVDEETLSSAIGIFERQSEVDFFINRNAKQFLTEQFDLWMTQFLFRGKNVWEESRIKQLQALRETAYQIIQFISQFEQELVKIWNKPKFVLEAHYVITLDRISERSESVLRKILADKGFRAQQQEWIKLGLIEKSIPKTRFWTKNKREQIFNREFNHFPIDTLFFPQLEAEIVALFDDLDEQLDGWLIQSENYQALKTILPKFKGRVQTIYIDPPFNKEQDADYFYSVKYKDATWLTILENRISIARDFLSAQGGMFVRCDANGNMYMRVLLDQLFGKENFLNELMVNRTKKIFHGVKGYNVACDSLFFYGNGEKVLFYPQYKKRERDQKWLNMHSPGERRPPERTVEGRVLYPPKGRHWTFRQEKIDIMYEAGRIRMNGDAEYIDMKGRKIVGMPQYLTGEHELLDSKWTDIPGYSSGHGFPTENSEALLRRVIESNSEKRNIIMDFFLGSGTTIATAHKLGRKWIGVEQGPHFCDVILPRMKQVLANNGHNEPSGISREVGWKGGGMFKYFALEQYENTLRKVKYSDSDGNLEQKNFSNEEDIFGGDLKLLDGIQLDPVQNTVRVQLETLYKNVDLPETLSHLLGKPIRRLHHGTIEFVDGEVMEISKIDYQILKPLLWW